MIALTLLNVLTVFVLVAAVAAFVLVSGALLRMCSRRVVLVPIVLGVAAALASGDWSWRLPVCAALYTLGAWVALTFVFGWLFRGRLDQREHASGRPLITPVLLVWAGALAFTLLVVGINQLAVDDAWFWPVAVHGQGHS
jgi:hypothetical protein